MRARAATEFMRKHRTRRRFERTHASIDAEWGLSPDDCRRQATVVSLSEGGCLVRTKVDELLSDKTIYLRFMLPAHHWEAHWMTLRGEIAYYYRGVGFAMTFKDLSAQEAETLKQLVLYWRELSGAPRPQTENPLRPPGQDD